MRYHASCGFLDLVGIAAGQGSHSAEDFPVAYLKEELEGRMVVRGRGTAVRDVHREVVAALVHEDVALASDLLSDRTLVLPLKELRCKCRLRCSVGGGI